MGFLELNDENTNKDNIFKDVDIIVDPELEDESTVDINDYLNKYILQCRICGNLFPSNEILDNDSECPICDNKSNNGFIYKGKLLKQQSDKNNELSDEEKEAIDNIDNYDNSDDEFDYNNDSFNTID